tara:strand:- start:51 stop:1235 length:1185 start_codon:yes stop_codon:yes gene_type:complete
MATDTVPTTVLDAAALAFHSTANRSLGCAQVRGLFWPLSCDHFVREHFELRHHIVRASRVHSDLGAALGFPSLLRAVDVHRMASVWEFKVGADHSQARFILPDSFAHDTEWADGVAADSAAIRRAHRKNCTAVFHNVELYWRPISLLSLSLTRLFGLYSQANIYYSPPALEAALHPHQDAQSVFVVQCEGRKTWTLLEPPARWKLRYNQRGKAGDVAPAADLKRPIDEVTLSPGDVLFIPRGVYHHTATPPGGAASLHVTIGVETDTDDFTWFALLTEAAGTLRIADAAQKLLHAQWADERLREALPLPLCRPAGSFGSAPDGPQYLAKARALLREHVNARPSAEKLVPALDAALTRRQALVEGKRRQLLQFMDLAPRPTAEDGAALAKLIASG